MKSKLLLSLLSIFVLNLVEAQRGFSNSEINKVALGKDLDTF